MFFIAKLLFIELFRITLPVDIHAPNLHIINNYIYAFKALNWRRITQIIFNLITAKILISWDVLNSFANFADSMNINLWP